MTGIFFNQIFSHSVLGRNLTISSHESSFYGTIPHPAEKLCEATVFAGLNSKKTWKTELHVVFESFLRSWILSALESELV